MRRPLDKSKAEAEYAAEKSFRAVAPAGPISARSAILDPAGPRLGMGGVMHHRIRRLAALASCLAALSLPATTGAQFGDVMKKAKEKAAQKAKEAAEKAQSKPESKPGAEPAAPAADTSATARAPETGTQKPGEGVWLNYDFVPGDRVLFFDDFSEDEVGNFPQRLELLEGNMEVAEWAGSRWLRASTPGAFVVRFPDLLPERFTIEFDYYAPWDWNSVEVTCELPEDTPDHGAYTKVAYSTWEKKGGLRAINLKDLAMGSMGAGADKKVIHCRVLADGKYMKVYANETRVANFPNTQFGRSKGLRISMVDNDAERPAMIANLRVAASAKRMYDALVAAGRVATHGILFDTGSDRIRPESTPTLKEIGQILKDHPELKLRIEGHTDDVGDDAANLSLSEKRANAVRAYLVGHGAEEARLQTKGLGETKPVTPNTTPEGRQNNRRVELVKL
jgi:outer membrane protein OmpA-like peptidoglycan-associated protein